MNENLDMKVMGNLILAIERYSSLFYTFKQLDPGQREKLTEFWASAFPNGTNDYDRQLWMEPNVHLVSQMWSNTSAGYQGFGGAAMTSAYTTVLENVRHQFIAVYYGSTLIYIAKIDDYMKNYSSVGYNNLPGLADCVDSGLDIIFVNKRA